MSDGGVRAILCISTARPSLCSNLLIDPGELSDPGSSGGRMQSKHLTSEIVGSRSSRQSAWLWLSLRSGVHYKSVLYCDEWIDNSTIVLVSFDLTPTRQFEQAIAVSMFSIIP